MRNAWKDDTKYILDLANAMIGEKALAIIIRENLDCNPSRIRSYVMASVMPKLQAMNDSTLGRICAYASSDGAHCGEHFRGTKSPEFINRTGLNDVFPTEERNYMFSRLCPGEFLTYIAMSVIVCVVADSIKQDEWKVRWHTWEMSGEEEGAFISRRS